jgi:hypothetical protein
MCLGRKVSVVYKGSAFYRRTACYRADDITAAIAIDNTARFAVVCLAKNTLRS